MNTNLEVYIAKVEKLLKYFPGHTKESVICELKNYILELQIQQKLTDDEVLEKLGSPRKFLVVYLSGLITSKKSNKMVKGITLTFYFLLLLTSGFILTPMAIGLSVGLYLVSIIVVIAGIVTFVFSFSGHEIPFQLFMFSDSINPIIASIVSFLIGVFLFMGAKKIWKTTFNYIKLNSYQAPRV